MKEIHEGIYGSHCGARTLVAKVLISGFVDLPYMKIARMLPRSVTNANDL